MAHGRDEDNEDEVLELSRDEFIKLVCRADYSKLRKSEFAKLATWETANRDKPFPELDHEIIAILELMGLRPRDWASRKARQQDEPAGPVAKADMSASKTAVAQPAQQANAGQSPSAGEKHSSFFRVALESLKKQAEGYAKQHPTLRHMLVLPEGETLLVPPRSGSHQPGHSSCHVPPAVSFGNSQVATVLPPASCWPPDLKPIRAVVAEQEFGPYRPLAQKPYRVHLFFGDVTGMAQLQSLATDLMNLAGDVDQAILDGHATLFFRSSSRIHGTDAEILDAWLCTVHWWAWKAVDSPIHTRPQVVLGDSAITADRMDQAVLEKLSFSTLDCDIFTATAATIDLFFRFFTVPPDLAWATDYPPTPKPQEFVPDAERAKTKATAQPGRDSRTSPVEQSSVKEPPKEAIITDKRNVPKSEPITNLPAAAEWERLRRDFDRRASEYPPLTLSIFMVNRDGVSPYKEKFDQPHHKVMLWQYMGNFRPGESPESDKPELTAFAVLEGQDTDLFRRMAYRAGSMIPAPIQTQFAVEIMKNVEKHDRPGKPNFELNHNPLAVWLNLVLMVAASLQPERLRRNTLAVDPFAASLAVVDLIVSKLEPKAADPAQPNAKGNGPAESPGQADAAHVRQSPSADDPAGPAPKTEARHVGSEVERQILSRKLFADNFAWLRRENRWQRELGRHAPTTADEVMALIDKLSIPAAVVDRVAEITDTMDNLNAVDDILIAAIKNDRQTAAVDTDNGTRLPPAIEPPANDEGKRRNPPRRQPSDEAIACYRASLLQGITQKQLAEQLTVEFKRLISQGQVSRWITEVKEFVESTGILPPVDLDNRKNRSKPTPQNPGKLDYLSRPDGRRHPRKSPQQRDSSDES